MNLDGVPVAVLYNKSDLPGAVPEEKLEAMVRMMMAMRMQRVLLFSRYLFSPAMFQFPV